MRAFALSLVLALAVCTARADESVPVLDGGSDLLARWLAAQNHGDFATYQSLYARNFTGVRRSGERVIPLDRAGWMADRARMFKRPMQVSASDVQQEKKHSALTITFTQEWASGSYHDVGKKRIDAALEDGQLRIVSEEMLVSAVDEELALLRALYPYYRTSDRHLASDDPTRVAKFQWRPRSDGKVVGLLDLENGAEREEEIALFDHRGGHPRPLAHERFPATGTGYELRPRELPIVGGEGAIEVVDQEPKGDGTVTRLTLWRRSDGSSMTDVFASDIDEDMPSCECMPVRRVEVTSRRQDRLFEVVEEITENATACHGRPRRHDSVHRWGDGPRYQ
jgi:hypothetical protein